MPDLTRKEVILVLATTDRARLAGVDLTDANFFGVVLDAAQRKQVKVPVSR